MWRTYLLVYPFLALYVAVVVPLFVPVTWLTGSIGPIYRMAQRGCRIMLWAGGVRVRVLHPERARMHPCCVYVGNHVSNIEAPALFSVLPRVAVIMKHSLGRIPLLGYAMRIGGFIRVDRQSRASRKQALLRAVETLQGGLSMLIFPEGTRNTSERLLPFRPGPFQMAIEAGVPVVPFTVHGAAELWPRGETYMRPGRLTVVFHAPVETDGLEHEDRIALMKMVRVAMQAALDAGPE